MWLLSRLQIKVSVKKFLKIIVFEEKYSKITINGNDEVNKKARKKHVYLLFNN